jgi:hypothetical protein
MVLCLAGLAPAGALAQESRQQAQGQQAQAPREVSNEALQQQITELWQGYRMLQQELALLRAQLQEPGLSPAVGGSGQGGTADTSAGQGRAVGRTGQGQPGQATGGSGPNVGGAQGAERATRGDVIVGTVRSITQDRLLLVDLSGRVFELDLTRQTRVIGPSGGIASVQALQEGTPVRTVAESGGDERADVRDIYILSAAPVPAR